MSGLGNGGGAYMKLHRKIGDFATVGVAVQLTVDPDGKVSDCGIGMAHGQRSPTEGLGLGLRLIEELADEGDVSTRPGHGTRVVMRFALRPSARA